MNAAIAVNMPCRRWSGAVPGARGLCRRAAALALAAPGRAGTDLSQGRVELAIVLADNETVRDLNRRFRGMDKATDVLSFPALDRVPPPEGAAAALGDVVIAFETTLAEAAAEGKTVAEHLAHLVVHGVLHLRGYDHERAAEAQAMERLEAKILARMGIADPYREALRELAG